MHYYNVHQVTKILNTNTPNVYRWSKSLPNRKDDPNYQYTKPSIVVKNNHKYPVTLVSDKGIELIKKIKDNPKPRKSKPKLSGKSLAKQLLIQVQNQHATTDKELKSITTQLAKLNSIKDDLNRQLTNAHAEINNLNKSNQQLLTEKHNLVNQLTNGANENRQLQGVINENRGEIKALSNNQHPVINWFKGLFSHNNSTNHQNSYPSSNYSNVRYSNSPQNPNYYSQSNSNYQNFNKRK